MDNEVCDILAYNKELNNDTIVWHPGDNTKKYGHIGFWKSQKRFQVRVWGSCKSLGGPGWCSVERVGWKPPNSFVLFFE